MNSETHMSNDVYTIKYPRRRLIRKSMTWLGKMLLSSLARVEIIGREKLPDSGPVILAGNHAAVLEAVMMAAYTPGLVEFLGNGDIPFDPNYAFITQAYDLIPINRGNLDQKGLQMGLDVLAQNGILCIFPEGGIWDPAQMQAQIGVAWLSYRSEAPIIPVGFGGIRNGLQKALALKRPKLIMHVGELIPPVTLPDNSLSMKANLESAAKLVLSKINSLVPQDDHQMIMHHVDDTFEIEITLQYLDQLMPIPDAYSVPHGGAYARFLFNPTLMDVFVRNLHLPIKPIKEVYRQSDLAPVITAWQSILTYLQTNPGFFTYRFGMEEGLAVKLALEELICLAQWVSESHFVLTLQPIHRYHNVKTGAQVIERGGCFPKSM